MNAKSNVKAFTVAIRGFGPVRENDEANALLQLPAPSVTARERLRIACANRFDSVGWLCAVNSI